LHPQAGVFRWGVVCSGTVPPALENVMSDPVQEFEAGLARLGGDVTDVFAACADENVLRAANAKLVGPSGDLTALLKLMPKLPGDRRKELGQRANQVKQAIQAAFDARLVALARAIREAELSGPQIDVSLPGRATTPGGTAPDHEDDRGAPRRVRLAGLRDLREP
jgi:phenylalanyl-tRNA synthetase alpha subunit